MTLIAIALSTLFVSSDMLIWCIPISLWIIILGYASSRLTRRISLLVFAASFGFFMLSKPAVMGYLNYNGLRWTGDTLSHLILTLSLGLATILFGYMLLPTLTRVTDTLRKNREGNKPKVNATNRSLIARSSLIVFLVTYPFSLWQLVGNLQTASEFGYTALYVASGGSSFASLASYGSAMNAVALFVFLATIPPRRLTYVVLVLATFPRALAMLTGDRGDFGTFMLAIVVYVVFRSRSTLTQLMKPRTMVVSTIVGILLIIPIFIRVGLERGVGARLTTLPDFLYGQGASLNVLEYGKEYAALLPNTNYLLWFADQGFFRLIFGSEGGLAGNSVGYAMSGTSFSHSLSYLVLGDHYLQGRGVGTSFLAEGYASLGYVGVVAIGLIYGLLLAWIDRFPFENIIMNALRLVILPTVFFAPRGPATGFLAELLSPATVLVVMLIWLIAKYLASVDS